MRISLLKEFPQLPSAARSFSEDSSASLLFSGAFCRFESDGNMPDCVLIKSMFINVRFNLELAHDGSTLHSCRFD